MLSSMNSDLQFLSSGACELFRFIYFAAVHVHDGAITQARDACRAGMDRFAASLTLLFVFGVTYALALFLALLSLSKACIGL